VVILVVVELNGNLFCDCFIRQEHNGGGCIGSSVVTARGYFLLLLETVMFLMLDFLWCNELTIVRHNTFRPLPYFEYYTTV
jgi:hypothetical protein